MGPRGRFYPYLYHCDYIGLLGTGFMQVFYLGRAPHTKETLPGFLKWRRVTRRPLVFRGLTGSQRTPGFRASQACYEVTCHVIWLRNFILAMEVVHSISKPLKLFCNNFAVVSFSRKTRSTSRSKHIDVSSFLLKIKLQSPSFQLSTRL